MCVICFLVTDITLYAIFAAVQVMESSYLILNLSFILSLLGRKSIVL